MTASTTTAIVSMAEANARSLTAEGRDALMGRLHLLAESARAKGRDADALALFCAFDDVADVADEMGDPEGPLSFCERSDCDPSTCATCR